MYQPFSLNYSQREAKDIMAKKEKKTNSTQHIRLRQRQRRTPL